jgi:hypothetical protein
MFQIVSQQIGPFGINRFHVKLVHVPEGVQNEKTGGRGGHLQIVSSLAQLS